MNSIHDLLCPLCGTPAQFQYQNFNDMKHIRCLNCNDFIISRSAERKLSKVTPQQKDEFSKNATTAPSGTILVVTGPAPSNSENYSPTSINQEYKPRQEAVKWKSRYEKKPSVFGSATPHLLVCSKFCQGWKMCCIVQTGIYCLQKQSKRQRVPVATEMGSNLQPNWFRIY